MANFVEKYWSLAAVPVFLGVIAMASCDSCWTYDTYCRGGEPCLRAWVSALSGWMAAAAAFATVRYIARQVEDARTNHREQMRVAAEPRVRAARRFLSFRHEVIRLTDRLQTEAQDAIENRSLGRLRSTLRQLHNQVSNPMFEEFDRSVNTTSTNASNVRHQIERSISFLDRLSGARQHQHWRGTDEWSSIEIYVEQIRLIEYINIGTLEAQRLLEHFESASNG